METSESRGLIGESLHRAWDAFRRAPWTVMGLGLLFVVASAVPDLHERVYHPSDFQKQLFSAIWWIGAGIPLTAGVAYALLRLLRGAPVRTQDVLLGYPKLGHLLLCEFSATVLGLLGLLILIVPGVIVFLGFSQCVLLILDQNERGLGGLERSWRMMKGYRIRFLGLVIVECGICLLGLILLGVGVIPATGVAVLATAAFYDRVLQRHPGLPDVQESLTTG